MRRGVHMFPGEMVSMSGQNGMRPVLGFFSPRWEGWLLHSGHGGVVAAWPYL